MFKNRRPNFEGLGARLAQNASAEKADHPVRHFVADEGLLYMPVDLVRPDPNQPRQHFDESALDDLTASVAEKGVLQPIIARKNPNGDGYVIVAGERRWRAAKAAGLDTLPVLVRPSDDALEVALIENLQRENLSAIEEAEALLHLKRTRGFTDEQLARVIGKSRQAVNESIALNELPDAIKNECRTSGIGSKSQLLTILRAGAPDAVEKLWRAFRDGDATTVRGMRERSETGKGRPQNLAFSYRSPAGAFRLTLTFSKPEATTAEIREALVETLASLHDDAT